MKLDYGSGYNPKKGYKTSDVTGSPYLDYHIHDLRVNCQPEIFDEVHCRNVVHHVRPEKLSKLFNEFIRILKPHGKLTISEPEDFTSNKCLDVLWYRFVIPRPDIYIGNEHVDFTPYIPKKLEKQEEFRDHSNVVMIYKKLFGKEIENGRD